MYISKIALALLVGTCTSYAVPIIIGTGNPGNIGTDNVLFNDDNLIHQGALIQGNFAGTGAGFLAEFSSASGTGGLQGSGGQAEIEGLFGNDPIRNLTFGLADGATFTKAIFNIDADADGLLSIAVNFLGASGSPYEELVALRDNGQNFFYIEADEGVAITSISLSTDDSGINVAKQFRIGGFANAVGVPDGGATAIMLGMGFLGLVGLCRRTNS
jgi:hypothetical protein